MSSPTTTLRSFAHPVRDTARPKGRSSEDIATRPEARGSEEVAGRLSGVITVCHPVWALGCGGLERQLLQTIAHLPPERFRHVLVVRCDTGVSPASSPAENVEIVWQRRCGRERLWPLRLASILRQRRVDVLHVRGLSMLVDSVLAARLAGGLAVAFSFHGFESPAADGRRFGRLLAAAYRAAARRCGDRWAVSRAAAEAVAHELRMSPDEFGVLPNGVDAGRYSPATNRNAVRRRLGLPDNRLVVLSVGNLKPIKGHDVLLEAVGQLSADSSPWQEGTGTSRQALPDRAKRARLGASPLLLRADGPRLCVVLVGEDHCGGELQRFVAKRLAGVDVRFVGGQDDPAPWYQAADLFVLPSRWEGMSNALLEAMACGLPTIATAVGGNIEVIETGRTGLLVKLDSAAELALAIRLLTKDEARRRALGAAARQYVVKHHAAAITAAAYGRRYAELVNW